MRTKGGDQTTLLIPRRGAIRAMHLGLKRGASDSGGRRARTNGILGHRRAERWPSGLRRTPGTRVDSKGSRGFKSPPLRQQSTPAARGTSQTQGGPGRTEVRASVAPSLVVSYRHVAQSVNHRGLGRAEFDPVGTIELNRLVELFG